MKLDTPTMEKINLDYNYIVPIFKGVRNIKALKDLGRLMMLTIEVNGESVNEFNDDFLEDLVSFVRINSYESLDYIYFNYSNGRCTSILFDVWSNDVETDFLTDIRIENLEDEYADGIRWVKQQILSKVYKDKNIILLKDIEDNTTDAIITTETTTAKEIQEIIDNVKSEVEDWSCEDIFNALPEDCNVQTLFFNEYKDNIVWY